MAKVEKLRTGKGDGPPPPTEAPRNIDKPARDKPEKKVSLDFKVEESTSDDFRAEAARVYGFKKGSMTKLFLQIWAEYNEQKSK